MLRPMGSRSDTLQLSVVADDLRLENSTGRDLLESVNHFRATPPQRYTPPSRRTARPTKITLDDPDELYLQTRQNQLRQKRSWIQPAMNAVLLIARLSSPMANLHTKHPASRPFLAPWKGFYWMQFPLLSLQILFVLLGFSSVLRGVPIYNRISFCHWLSVGLGIGWQWCFGGHGSMEAAGAFSLIWAAIAWATLVMVKLERQRGLQGIWQHTQRQSMKFRDYWFIELPMLVEGIWAYLVFINTANYVTVSEYLNYHPGNYFAATLATQMLSAAVTSLVVTAGLAILFYGRKRGGNTPLPLAATWWYLDLSVSFGKDPDAVLSPHLAWVDSLHGEAFQYACSCIGVLFLLLTLVSLGMQASRAAAIWRGMRNESDGRSVFSWLGAQSIPPYPNDYDWDTTGQRKPPLNEPSAPKRRPSEFLMREDSALTDANTPVRKK